MHTRRTQAAQADRGATRGAGRAEGEAGRFGSGYSFLWPNDTVRPGYLVNGTVVPLAGQHAGKSCSYVVACSIASRFRSDAVQGLGFQEGPYLVGDDLSIEIHPQDR